MAYKLVCVHPFHGWQKGQIITDQDVVNDLLDDREHHFVKLLMSDEEVAAEKAERKAKIEALFAKEPAHDAAHDA